MISSNIAYVKELIPEQPDWVVEQIAGYFDKYDDNIRNLKRRIAELSHTIYRLCDIYVVDDYYSGTQRKKAVENAIKFAIQKGIEKMREVNGE